MVSSTVRRQTTPTRRKGVAPFVQALLNDLAGQVIVIGDGAPMYRSRVVHPLLADGAAKRLHLERLPGYALDLNPDEGVWNNRNSLGERPPAVGRPMNSLGGSLPGYEEKWADRREFDWACPAGKQRSRLPMVIPHLHYLSVWRWSPC